MLRAAVLCLVLPFGVPPSLASGCGDVGRVRYAPRTFLGYACTDDCEPHKAGFAWAEKWAVADVRSCEPLGHLEAQGCRAYVEESIDAEAAGERWAVENEIADPSLCDGAGERFRSGCTEAAGIPPVSLP
jgi:hypothetical protein